MTLNRTAFIASLVQLYGCSEEAAAGRWDALQRKHDRAQRGAPVPQPAPAPAPTTDGGERRVVLSRHNVAAVAIVGPDGMNKTERAYADHLEALARAGQIGFWDREPEKLRLADNTFYTPDFRVLTLERHIEFHEVKGYWRDDARVKIKVAARLHPYRFVAVHRRGATWEYELIPMGWTQHVAGVRAGEAGPHA